MFIQTQSTPNPASLMFYPGKPVMEVGSADFPNARSAMNSPLAKALYGIDGTEIDGSILCPASFNSVVGIKQTVGLTSRAGVIPISPRQDTVGPICWTVADAIHVLDTIVGIDSNDNATNEVSQYIPMGGYAQFLNSNGLKGKRLGIVSSMFLPIKDDAFLNQTFEQHFITLRAADDHGKLATIYKSEKRGEMEKEGYKILGNSGDQWSDLLGSQKSIRTFKIPKPMYYIP